jgi:hypothetical protein
MRDVSVDRVNGDFSHPSFKARIHVAVFVPKCLEETNVGRYCPRSWDAAEPASVLHGLRLPNVLCVADCQREANVLVGRWTRCLQVLREFREV